jgi:uncharacterized protein (DUF2147 family)
MKKPMLAFACALALSVPSIAAAADDNYGCDSVNFGEEVLAKLPNAKKLCRGVTEKNGGVYVKYVGRVVASSPESTTIEFIDKDKKAVSRATFKPAADQMADVDGKKVKYSDLKKGTELRFYIENKRWGLYGGPNDTAMQILSVEQL